MLELYQIAFVPGNLGKDLYGKDPSPNVRAKSGDTVPQHSKDHGRPMWRVWA